MYVYIYIYTQVHVERERESSSSPVVCCSPRAVVLSFFLFRSHARFLCVLYLGFLFFSPGKITPVESEVEPPRRTESVYVYVERERIGIRQKASSRMKRESYADFFW